MTRQLVFVHGRAQENKDSVALKAEWIEAFEDGLAKSGLKLPVSKEDIHFPFYGDTLYQLSNGDSPGAVADVIVRGANGASDPNERLFIQAVAEEVRKKAGITNEQLLALSNPVVVEKGPGNWEWVQAILRAIDRYVPHGSGTSIALFTHDVYQYLTNEAVRKIIDDGVSAAIASNTESIVVSHSLGTVVAYNLLRQRGSKQGWKVPLFVTLGSPLGVEKIRKTVSGLARPTCCPPCASMWFNAMDERDMVALYPLDPDSFPLDPPTPSIENKCDVRNKTRNRHGITGYLDDKHVAKRIHDALLGG